VVATISLEYSRWVACLPSIIYGGHSGLDEATGQRTVGCHHYTLYDEAISRFRDACSRTRFSSALAGLWGALYPKATHGEALVEARKFLLLPGDHERRHVLRLCFADDSCAFAGAMRSAGRELDSPSQARLYVNELRRHTWHAEGDSSAA